MKNIISFLLTLIFLSTFFSCSEGITTNDPVDNSQTSLQKITLEVECTCANNQYPPIDYSTCLGIEWCDIPNNIVSYPRETICIFWSNLVSSPTGRIYKTYDCSGPGISYSRPRATYCNLSYTGHPITPYTLSWNFIWCDYYVIQIKIDDGNWQDIRTIQNDHGTGYTSMGVFPAVVNAQYIYYRVKTKIGNSESISNVVVAPNIG